LISSIKGEPNGLESAENRRSVGRHGNQHVYVRRPQVSGSVVPSRSPVSDGGAFLWRLPCCPIGDLPADFALPVSPGSDVQSGPSYFPPRSTLSFSFSFICLTAGSRGASPVVWVVEAGGALFGTELCSWGCVAGRVAVADGGELDCAFAASTLKRKTPASSDTASVVVVAFIGLAPLRSFA